MNNKIYDVIIVGAGPAGLTAGIYAARYRMDALIIGKILGGLAGTAHEVCNFPSHEKISGAKLMVEMIAQVKKLGVEIKNEEVMHVKDSFEVITNKGKYKAKKIILATGLERKMLGLKGEKEFLGKGVSYCATCDANFYKDKTVAVIGGGDAALDTALLLSKVAKIVYVIYRQNIFYRAKEAIIQSVLDSTKVKTILNSAVTKLIGKERLEEIEINGKDKLKVDGVFIEVGSIPGIELAEKLNIKLEGNYIKTDKRQRTNVGGVFAAGDVTNNAMKQIVTACAEGAVAVNSAYEELTKGTGKKKIY